MTAGPYARGRIIDLSRRAAELLDVVQTGTAKVRVTYLGRADLEGGAPPPPKPRREIASALPAAPAAKMDIAPLSTGAGARRGAAGQAEPAARLPVPGRPSRLRPINRPGRSSRNRFPPPPICMCRSAPFPSSTMPRRFCRKLGGDLRISALQRNGQTLYRVRTGPLNSVEDADAALSRITGAGSNDAHIVVDQ